MTNSLYPVHEFCGGALMPAARVRKARPTIGKPNDTALRYRGYCNKCRSFVACSDAELHQAEVACLIEEISNALGTSPRVRARQIAAPIPDGWPAPSWSFADGRLLWWHARETGDAARTELWELGNGKTWGLGHVEVLAENRRNVVATLDSVRPVLAGLNASSVSVRVSGWIDVCRVIADPGDFAAFVSELRGLDPSAPHAA